MPMRKHTMADLLHGLCGRGKALFPDSWKDAVKTMLGVESRSAFTRLEEELSRSREELHRLEARISRQQEILNELSSDPKPEDLWLYKNRVERMDANSGLFDQDRREFHINRYRFACAYVHEKRVADIACGTGYGSALLYSQGGANQVIGIDVSSEAVAYAQRKYGSESVTFCQSNAERTGLDDASVDVVVSFETIEHIDNDVGFLSECHRLLAPDGVLVVSTPNNWPYADHPFHVRTYDYTGFMDVLAHHFIVKNVYNQYSRGLRELALGIEPTTLDNEQQAECFIAVARKR